MLTRSICFFSLTQDYNLELQYRKPFLDIWKEEKDDPILGPLSERMGVRARGGGPMLVKDEELEAASMLSLLVSTIPGRLRGSQLTYISCRLLPCFLLLQSLMMPIMPLPSYSSDSRPCHASFPIG